MVEACHQIIISKPDEPSSVKDCAVALPGQLPWVGEAQCAFCREQHMAECCAGRHPQTPGCSFPPPPPPPPSSLPSPPPSPPPDDFFNPCPGPRNHLRGVYFTFSESDEIVNNLGGYPGGEDIKGGVACLPGAPDMEPDPFCPCGCGCRCTNDDDFADYDRQELRYSRVVRIAEGSDAPPIELDLVVTNQTAYEPWNSRNTGHHDSGGQRGYFAQISLLQGTQTRFRYEFQVPNTDPPARYRIGYGAPPPSPLSHKDST